MVISSSERGLPKNESRLAFSVRTQFIISTKEDCETCQIIFDGPPVLKPVYGATLFDSLFPETCRK